MKITVAIETLLEYAHDILADKEIQNKLAMTESDVEKLKEIEKYLGEK